jgi:acetyl coenzyme A synthetase (ADP forming)-like protein
MSPDAEAPTHSLDPILRPRSIAVIGASRSPDSIGWQIVDNLLAHRFQGPVYPVNPKASAIHSIRAYPSIADVPGPVDLGVVVVPAEHVIEVAGECARAGVKGLVVISAGFREIGGVGTRRERALLEVLAGTGIRIVGPNCMGVINTEPGVSMNATFAPNMPPPGPVAMMSQSGAMGVSILDYAGSLGIGLSMFVSAGNKADVAGRDLLEYWRDDPKTRVVLMYLENFGDPRRFVDLGRELTPHKPIFVVKSGRTGAGARAVASHTGSLAQTELATDALIAQAGAIRAQTVSELFDMARAFANQPLPKGNRVAIVTNAGGPGIIIADACEANGLDVVPLSEETTGRLRDRLPEEASVKNPVDLIASATADLYEHTVRCVLADPQVDAVIAAFVPPLGVQTRDVAEAIVHVNEEFPDKPIMAVLMGRQGLPAGRAELRDAGVPAYVFPESAAGALGAMWRYAVKRAREQGEVRTFDVDDAAVTNLLRRTRARGARKLSEPDALRLIEAYGIPTVAWRFVPSEGVDLAGRVVAAAEALGMPVALKLVSPDIVHKTDVGAVVLHLEDDAEVRGALDEMFASVRRQGDAGRGPTIDGVLVQRMAPRGRETIVGLTGVPSVGTLVMFGLGGVYVEVLRDVVLRLCPLRDTDAQEMIREVKMHRLLEAVRGEPPRDRAALGEAILRVAQLGARHPEIAEMDINPLIALERGAVAVDVRVQLSETPARPETPAASQPAAAAAGSRGIDGGHVRASNH